MPYALSRMCPVSYRCRHSRTASYSATRFSAGVPAWTLWTVLKTNPPPRPKISIRSRTSRRISSGVPKGSVFCVSTPPPQNVICSPNLLLQRPRVHAGRRALHRIEDVEAGVDDVGQQGDHRAARVDERLPRRVRVDPVVHAAVERLVELAVGRRD